MRGRILTTVSLATVLVACGGGSPTQAPGGATQAPGGATTDPGAPVATPGGNGGNKPAGWDQYGKARFEIGGPASRSGELGFIPAGSLFGGSAGSSLSFTVEGTEEILSILVGADGKVVVSYGSTDMTVPAAECTTSNWNIGATEGSGSFDCTAAFIIMASGATLQGGTLEGSFTAKAS